MERNRCPQCGAVVTGKRCQMCGAALHESSQSALRQCISRIRRKIGWCQPLSVELMIRIDGKDSHFAYPLSISEAFFSCAWVEAADSTHKLKQYYCNGFVGERPSFSVLLTKSLILQCALLSSQSHPYALCYRTSRGRIIKIYQFNGKPRLGNFDVLGFDVKGIELYFDV